MSKEIVLNKVKIRLKIGLVNLWKGVVSSIFKKEIEKNILEGMDYVICEKC